MSTNTCPISHGHAPHVASVNMGEPFHCPGVWTGTDFGTEYLDTTDRCVGCGQAITVVRDKGDAAPDGYWTECGGEGEGWCSENALGSVSESPELIAQHEAVLARFSGATTGMSAAEAEADRDRRFAEWANNLQLTPVASGDAVEADLDQARAEAALDAEAGA